MFNINLMALLRSRPQAVAEIKGSSAYPQISGKVYFYAIRSGTVVVSMISSLPTSEDKCKSPVFGFHIHNGTSCTGDNTDYFKDALAHYNPNECPHPYHSGDMPPLFGVKGTAFSAFLTDRFSVNEIIGKTVLIHSQPDDFITQPAGDSGTKIACGEIR